MKDHFELSQQTSITVRTATANDLCLIFEFIQKKSTFDREIGAFSGPLNVSKHKLNKTLFNDVPFAYVLLGEQDGIACGFALYGFRYSSFAGQPSVWLDDLYVNVEMRSQGVGAMLMQRLAHIAQHYDCTHLAWTADARNLDGLRFYNRLGASITAQHGHQCFLSWVPPTLDDDEPESRNDV